MIKTTWIVSLSLGTILALTGAGSWFMVRGTLDDQSIVTASDACLANRSVEDPFTAFCQARAIEEHTLSITGGKHYAELGRDDPLRDIAMNSAFLQSSLFTSVIAFGLSALTGAAGIVFILLGLSLRGLALRTAPTSSPPADLA